MTNKNTGGHAFPTQTWEYDGGNQVLQYQEPGMSLRDWFAGLAMQGWIVDSMRFDEASIKRAAQFAYAMADAMLKAREET